MQCRGLVMAPSTVALLGPTLTHNLLQGPETFREQQP